MLARSFKTAKELSRTDPEYTALCRVLAFFEQEQCRLYPSIPHDRDFADGIWFNMMVWENQNQTRCGTVACIGGWANHLAGENVFHLFSQSVSLNKLFGGYNSNKNRNRITVAEAAMCLRTYLETGIVDWDKATAS